MTFKTGLLIFAFASYVLLITLISFLFKKKEPPSSLFYSIDDSQLDNFWELKRCLDEERFKPYFNSQTVLFQRLFSKKKIFSEFQITYDISTRLILRHISRKEVLNLLRTIFKRMKTVSFSNQLNLLELKREVLDSSVFEFIDSFCQWSFDLITTNSNLFRLPKAFENGKKGKRIMLWYSINNIPIRLDGDDKMVAWNICYVRDSIDIHLVWTNVDKNFLLDLGQKNVVDVGSILFRDKKIRQPEKEKFTITFFEVTPVGEDSIIGRKIYSEYGDIFYSEANLIFNLQKFFFVMNQMRLLNPERFRLRVKVKRKYHSSHSENYIQVLKRGVRELGIDLIPANQNIYETVSESDLVIGIPYTSPVILARELNRDSFFFSVHSKEWKINDYGDEIPVISNETDLLKAITNKLIF